MAEKVNIQIVYNGGWPRAHTVSREFLVRLEAWLKRHPKADVVWWEVKR